ncbi:MAG: hypothetical protein HONBIEJF_00677 [Fimbriimonadaceae bacterium]|nr:hypothetical protein [Fimbriimonadaceae bacterium]
MADLPLPALPDPSSMQRLHPAIRKVWRYGAIVGGLFTVLALAGVGAGIGAAIGGKALIGAVAGLGVGIVLVAWSVSLIERQYQNWGYLLTNDALIARWGVFWRTARYVPRDAIQHVDMNQGPIDRRNGLAQILVYTAATPMAVVTIPGLSLDEAKRIRDLLLPRLDDTP